MGTCLLVSQLGCCRLFVVFLLFHFVQFFQLDLTNTGIQDVVGHGTHVAGIAAAARNGTGINGVAFDANLACKF